MGDAEFAAEGQARAVADGCSAGDRSTVLGHGALMVSATGKTTLTPADFGLLPDHAIVANAASEKDEEKLSEGGIRRSTFKGKDVPLGDFAAFDDKFHRVMRGEDGHETHQLTRALMLAGALQASSAKGVGLIDLDEAVQTKIVDTVRAHLAQGGLDLDKPDFRGMRS